VWHKSRCTATCQSAGENDGLLRNSRELIGCLRHTKICATKGCTLVITALSCGVCKVEMRSRSHALTDNVHCVHVHSTGSRRTDTGTVPCFHYTRSPKSTILSTRTRHYVKLRRKGQIIRMVKEAACISRNSCGALCSRASRGEWGRAHTAGLEEETLTLCHSCCDSDFESYLISANGRFQKQNPDLKA
jgi:hypothetical protein